MIPQTSVSWVTAINTASTEDRLNLVWKRPIVAWFSNKKVAIRRLIELSGRLGNDYWIIQGRDDESGQDCDVTIAPTSLEKALGYLTPENGWVLCEFTNEIEFYMAALRYLQEK